MAGAHRGSYRAGSCCRLSCRLLRSVSFAQAVRNDCASGAPDQRLPRQQANQDSKSPFDERPVIPVSTLVELLDNVPPRYRALLLLATFANLRFGELAGLRRNQVDLDACEVRVNASTSEMDDGRLIDGTTKSRAGIRTSRSPPKSCQS
jgi:integrase